MVKLDNNRPGIGIYGGTFDPVHHGHLRTALEVCQQLALDHVRLVPNHVAPHRSQPKTSAAHRAIMLELAVKNSPELIVDTCELDRDGPSYTVDTLQGLRTQFPEHPLFFILGTDALAGLKTWSRWQQLLDWAHLVIITRPGELEIEDVELTDWLKAHAAAPSDVMQLAGKVWHVDVSSLAISSTQIRADLAAERSIRFLVPDAVISLISQTGLYRTTETE